MHIHCNRQIDVRKTIDIFARKHPRRLLEDIYLSILAEWMINHKTTVIHEECNVFSNLSIINFDSVSLGSKICNPLMEILVTFGTAEIFGNLCSNSRKCYFWGPNIPKSSGGACPRASLAKSAFGTGFSFQLDQRYYEYKPLYAKMLTTPLIKGLVK